MNRREVLSQSAKVGIVVGIPSRLRPLRDGLCARAIVASQRELIEELAYYVAEVFAGADPPRHPREGFGKPLASGRVGSEPIGACG
jgi:hypothetical protein